MKFFKNKSIWALALVALLLVACGSEKKGTIPTFNNSDSSVTTTGSAEEPQVVEEEPVVEAEPEPVAQEPVSNGLTICIDPGHQAVGDSTQEPMGPGASETKARDTGGTYGRTSGLHEYELNLMVSFKLREELEGRGYRVVMTREQNDGNWGNIDRATVANEAGAAAFVRVHANGSEDTSVNGAMTICQTPSNPYNGSLASESKRLSTDILDCLVDQTGCRRQYVWETDTMSGINWSQVPVTIVEMGYMSNPTEDSLMASDDYQAKIVTGIANGIDRFLGR